MPYPRGNQAYQIPDIRYIEAEVNPKNVRIGSILKTVDNTYVTVGCIESFADKLMSCGIWRVRDTITGVVFAHKRISTADPFDKTRAKHELAVLKQLSRAGGSYHVNMLVDYFINPNIEVCNLVIEYCDARTVADEMEKYTTGCTRMPEAQVWHIFAAMAQALLFCHHGMDFKTQKFNPKWNTVCHLDIKPTNVLLTRQQQRHPEFPRVVLGDFGCSVTLEDVVAGRIPPLGQQAGTPGWYAPEFYLEPSDDKPEAKRYGKPTDIWQCGGLMQVIGYENDKEPETAIPNMKLVDKRTPFKRFDKFYSQTLRDMVCCAMQREVFCRIDALSICKEIEVVMTKNGMQF